MIYSLLMMCSVFFATPVKKNHAEIVTLAQLQAKTIQNNDTVYVVNFWATWCKPCVAELPYFEEAGKEFAGKKVKVVLVCLNFVSDKLEVNRFIERKRLQNDVYLLNEDDANVWINKVDANWSGSIPATVIYKNGKKIFFQEGDFEKQQDLNSLIQTKINN